MGSLDIPSNYRVNQVIRIDDPRFFYREEDGMVGFVE